MEAPAAVDWASALTVLAVGFGLGALFIWRVLASSRGAVARPGAVPLERRDLLGKRDVLFRQLRELEDLAAKRSPEQLARERYAFELEAARVLQALDALPSGPVSAAAAPAAPAPEKATALLAEKPALRGFLWGTGSMAVIGLLLYLVVSAARPREEGQPGGRAQSPAAADSEEAQAKAAIARNPDDLEARLALARLLLARQDMMGVWNETHYVLQRSPGDPRALSYQSLVRLAMGQADLAEGMLKKAIAAAPDQFDAYVHLALVYTQMGRAKDAQKTMVEAKKRFPEQAEVLTRLEGEMSRSATPSSLPDNPHASVPPPPAAAGAPPPPAGKGKRVAGVLDIDPLLAAEVSPGAIVFITVREAGFGAGPPLAAKRLVAPSFPLRFEIGQADSMTGEELPKELLLEARIDSDGDPMTRSPNDPKARLDDVKAGATAVRLVLKR